jgi:hypothetical protein
MKTLFRSALLATALAAAATLPARAQEAPAPAGHEMSMMRHGPVLNLSAYGTTRVAPDLATINLGVMTEAPSAAEATRQNAARMSALVAALKRQGVAEKDVQTSNLSLNAVYDYQENQPARLRGYQASNQVTVTVYDLARLGQTVDATVAAGGNQVNGIGFGLRDPQKAEDAARLEAVARLKAKADLYARATGLRLKALRSLTEGGGYVPRPPVPLMAMAKREADVSTPVASGELELRVDVQGVYDLEN